MKPLFLATLLSLSFHGAATAQSCMVQLHILGAGQDAGAPQIGNKADKAWQNESERLLATSLALTDLRTGSRYLFEATPDIREQLHTLDETVPPHHGSLGINGVFLTHAHIGHYAGLMFFGHESAGTQDIPVFAMPRMKAFLEKNGPWSQLVDYSNIKIQELTDQKAQSLGNGLNVIPIQVPHRDEYSETVAFIITGPSKSALFVPDIDSWDEWQADYGISIEELIQDVDLAFLDATFFDDFELPGRDMSKIPHPRVKHSIDRFAKLRKEHHSKVHFIHFNHSNPIRFETSEEHQYVLDQGFNIAKRGQQFCLSDED